jgi:hypothetical protein
MKKIKVLFLLIVTFFLYSCNKNEYKVKSKDIDFKSISIIKNKTKNILDIGKIKKAVKIETKNKSMIGNIDKVICDKNGDFYIADYYSSKKVFRFNKKGNFIRSYGKIGQGPGEYNSILSFALDSESNVFLLGNYKLIKFDKNGKLTKEVKNNFLAEKIIIMNNLLYVYVLRYSNFSKNKKQILILNTDLKKVGEILNYDTRLEKYLYIPRKIFAKNQDNLYFIDIYDCKLNIFNQKSHKMSCLELPNKNASLDNIWGKRRLNEKDIREIKNKIHRFNSIFSFNDNLLLYEFYRHKNIYDFWLLNLKTKKAIIFHYSDMELYIKQLFFSISGSYDKGVILVINGIEELNKYKEYFPVLNDIEFSIEDNPILALFEFNKFE